MKTILIFLFCAGWCGVSPNLRAQSNPNPNHDRDHDGSHKSEGLYKSLDTIELSHGGSIRGRVLDDSRKSGRRVVTVQLESGGVIELDAASLVRRVRKFDDVDQEFQKRFGSVGDSTEELWDLYTWCENQPAGKRRFADQRRYILERIIAIEPEDTKARRALGYEKIDGRWHLTEAWYRAYGYRRKGTTWQSTLDSEYSKMINLQVERKRERRKQLDRWFDQASKPTTSQAAARAQLLQMLAEDHDATIAVLFEWLSQDKKMTPGLRPLYLEAFGTTPPNFMKIGALCQIALQDPDTNLRDRAVTLLLQPGFSPEATASLLAGYLNPNHVDINKIETVQLMERAAYIIGELGARNQIMPLINALEIHGTILINNPGRTQLANVEGNMSFNPGSGPIEQPYIHQSEAVQVALKKITEQDFGFNQTAWTTWYLENFTANNRTFRADQ